MLVRGTRIENIEPEKVINVITEAYQIDPLIVTPAVAAPMLGILLIILLVKSGSKNKKSKKSKDESEQSKEKTEGSKEE